MPFKIIETIEKGQKRLCIIPSLWESKGLLRWPRKRLDINKLVKDENSKPLDNWSTSKCSVKRLLSSYEEARKELDLMVQNSDTEIDNTMESIDAINKNNINLNALANQLVLNQPEKQSTSSTVTTSTPVFIEGCLQATTAAEYVVQYVDDSDMATISVDNHPNQVVTQTPPIQTQSEENNDVNLMLKLILENQAIMAQTINSLAENQNKIFRKLASLSVQIDDGFSSFNQTKNTDVVMLGESSTIEREAFIMKPIDSIKELEDMELLLSDKNRKFKLLQQYSFVCSQSDGKGATCAYKILDIFFSREFLCQCSWTGGSRKSDEVKIGLMRYKNVLKFYYELVRSWDKTYSEEDNEHFFKTVLKNSVKRKLSKRERASTKRMRTKKNMPNEKNIADISSPGPSGKNKLDQGNQDNDQSEMNTNANEKVIINEDPIKEKGEEEAEEEEEESLC